MNTIKKILCTTLAALTVVSGSAVINKTATGTSFGNSITAEAAAKKGIAIPVYYPACKSNEKSIVDGLKYIGVDSSFNNRGNIAVVNGIVSKKSDYKGTYDQNVAMLKKLRNGKLVSYYIYIYVL